MIRQLYIQPLFYSIAGSFVMLLVAAFFFPALTTVFQVLLILFFGVAVVDIVWSFISSVEISAQREMSDFLSLSDDNRIAIHIRNRSKYPLDIEIIDEMPFQLQLRNTSLLVHLAENEDKTVRYTIRPVSRGAYEFGNLHLFVGSRFGLFRRRITFLEAKTVKVYPSIIQMKKLSLFADPRLSQFQGIRKMRRIGHSYEFEQIKEYVRGDDYRSINWKATGRHSKLMVNQFEDEKSKQIFSVIDTGRTMKMPFDKLSLLDYAINSSLAFSNVILQKRDKAGLISFSNRVHHAVKPDNRSAQMRYILDSLYKREIDNNESDFEMLYTEIKRVIKSRSMLMLYTNFESMYALERALPALRKISRNHLLVVIFFTNVEVEKFIENDPEDLKGIYDQTIAREMLAEKQLMAQLLVRHGIQTLTTRPSELSVNAINKYLELKARGLI